MGGVREQIANRGEGGSQGNDVRRIICVGSKAPRNLASQCCPAGKRLVQERVPQIKRESDRGRTIGGNRAPQQAVIGRFAAEVLNVVRGERVAGRADGAEGLFGRELDRLRSLQREQRGFQRRVERAFHVHDLDVGTQGIDRRAQDYVVPGQLLDAHPFGLVRDVNERNAERPGNDRHMRVGCGGRERNDAGDDRCIGGDAVGQQNVFGSQPSVRKGCVDFGGGKVFQASERPGGRVTIVEGDAPFGGRDRNATRGEGLGIGERRYALFERRQVVNARAVGGVK